MAIINVIKYGGGPDVFVWKSPITDFNTGSQLIVGESQEAIFIKNGQVLDTFGPGKYTLETENLPIISKLIKLTTGGVNQFSCDVYFINKVEQLNMKWGTDSRVEYIEPTYNFPLSVGASGEMNLTVKDGKKLLIKVLGNGETLNKQDMISIFKPFLMSKIKPYIAKQMKENSISIFEIDEHLLEFSSGIKELLNGDFDDYGVELSKFMITTFVKPEDDQMYQKFKSLHFRKYADVAEAELNQQVELINACTEAQKLVIDSEAQATKRAKEGYTYQQEKSFEVAHAAASNEASGQFTNMGVGLGAMAGVGMQVGGMVGSAINNAMNQTNATNQSAPTFANAVQSDGVCPKCNAPLVVGAKFCLQCGEKIEQANAKVFCPSCGNELPAGSKFCMNCGTKIG